MIKTTSIEYQNMMDVAIQECGGIASVFDLALLNGLSVTEELAIGTKLQTPNVQTSTDVAQFFKKQGIKIATVGAVAQITSIYAVGDYVEQNYWV